MFSVVAKTMKVITSKKQVVLDTILFKKKILKYLKHYSKFHDVFII